MAEIHSNTTTLQPAYAGQTASTEGKDPVAAASRAPREISADSVDALMVEALTQSQANPAAMLEPPPPATPETTAAAASTLTTIDPHDVKMSIEALLDQLALEQRRAGELMRQGAVAMQAHEFKNEQAALLAQAQTQRDSIGAIKAQAAIDAAATATSSIASGVATYNRPMSRDVGGRSVIDGSKGWSAGGEGASGLLRAAGEVGKTEFKEEEIKLNAAGSELGAVAAGHRKNAETVFGAAVQTANSQLQASQDSIAKNEQARQKSRDSLNRL